MMTGYDHYIPVLVKVVINDFRVPDLIYLSDFIIRPTLAYENFQAYITEEMVKSFCQAGDLVSIFIRKGPGKIPENDLPAVTNHVICDKIQEIREEVDDLQRKHGKEPQGRVPAK